MWPGVESEHYETASSPREQPWPNNPERMALTVLVPIYNDWAAVAMLIKELDRELSSAGRTAGMLIIDDGSSTLPAYDTSVFRSSALIWIEILHLRRNLGHQRAIAVGLAHLEARGGTDAVVVMDGDGEDRPADVNRLVSALERDGGRRVVFAERTRRSEGVIFASLYLAYRVVHRLLTGEKVRVGNFSVIPSALLPTLVSVSDLWNHFAAAVFHARIPFTTISTDRGTRYAGDSQMNFVALVTHGLSAMSVFGDRVGVRLLIAASGIAFMALVAVAAFLGWHVAAGIALGGWLPVAAVAALLLLVVLVFATSLGFVFIILAARGSGGFLPFREFRHYVSHTTSWPLTDVRIAQHVRRH